MKGWYKLAKPGTFTDCHGNTYTITKERLELAAKGYADAGQIAPITIGHPKSQKEPAWGWVRALKMVGDELYFQPFRLVAEFAELVNKGMYANVSASFNLPDWTLNHIAFLGAVPPAIKGLGQVCGLEFASDSAQVATVDLSECVSEWNGGRVEFAGVRDNWVAWQLRLIGRILKRFREQKIEVDGLEAANKLLDEYEAEQLGTEPPEEPSAPAQFSTPTQEGVDMTLEEKVNSLTAQVAEFSGKFTTMQTALQSVQQENAALRSENAALRQVNEQRAHAEFCDALIAEGKLLPDQKAATIATMVSLAGQANKVEFAGKQITPLDIYKDQLNSAPKIVEFAHLATKTASGGQGGDDPYVTEGKAIAASINR